MSNIYKKVTAIIVSILVISSSFVWTFDKAYAKEKLNIDAKAGIIYLADTDEILWEKGLDYVCDIASITKLLTTTVALDYVNVNDRVVFEENEISIDDLLHLVLMESNNDAARTLAEEAVVKAGKDMSWFINLMNEHVNEIGCQNAKFYNPSGLYDENMVSVEDVVKIAQSAFSNEIIRNICGLTTYRLSTGREVKTTNQFLTGESSFNFDSSTPLVNENNEDESNNEESSKENASETDTSHILGGSKLISAKTGTFGHGPYHGNMVALLEINGMECYVAILDASPELRYSDMKKLINEAMGLINPYTVFHANDQFEEAKIWGGRVNKVNGIAKDEGLINLPAGVSPSLVTTEVSYYEKLEAPISEGDIIGHISIYLSEEEVRSIDLAASESIDKGWFLSKYRITNKQTIIGFAIIFVILFLFIMMLSIRAANIRKKKKLREKRLKEEAKKKLEIEKDRERRNWKYR